MRFPTLLLFLLAVAGLSAQSTALQRADALAAKGEEAAALEAYRAVGPEDPGFVTARIRTAYYATRVGNRLTGEPRDALFREAMGIAGWAARTYPDRADAHLALAIAQGRMALVAPARDRMAVSLAIREHARRALAIDPHLAGAWHVLGLWHHRMGRLSTAEREAAVALYGQALPQASPDSALVFLERSVRLAPGVMLYRYDLARVMRESGHAEAAIPVLDALLALPPATPDDPALLERARAWRAEKR